MTGVGVGGAAAGITTGVVGSSVAWRLRLEQLALVLWATAWRAALVSCRVPSLWAF